MKNRPKEKTHSMSLRLTPEQRAKLDLAAAKIERETGCELTISGVMRKLINDLPAA
ncbi:hypothetical protein J4061_004466 [Salmonella enterica]|nr:hypothetical protein [Salmonella enterica]